MSAQTGQSTDSVVIATNDFLNDDGDENDEDNTPQLPFLHSFLHLRQHEFWIQEYNQLKTDPDFTQRDLPVARLRSLLKMHNDNKVSMECVDMMGYACELFIKEITKLSWEITDAAQRRMVSGTDVTHVSNSCFPEFDFLVDIVDRPSELETRQLEITARKLRNRLSTTAAPQKSTPPSELPPIEAPPGSQPNPASANTIASHQQPLSDHADHLLQEVHRQLEIVRQDQINQQFGVHQQLPAGHQLLP